MADSIHLIPVILSGGAGTRLWPLSRESHPKPFLTLPDGESLLQKTFKRANSFTHAAEIITITNKEYYLKTKAEYEKNNHSLQQSFLLEPQARNTAPAISLATLKVYEDFGPDALLLILPADHLIPNAHDFLNHAEKAFCLAQQDHIVTFGIKPNAPETGFGYIEFENDSPKVKRFIEKPNLEAATDYFNSGKYLWNAGMFCFKAGHMLNQFELHAPQLLSSAKICWKATKQKNTTQSHVTELETDCFSTMENISIDYAIMEKSQDVAVIPCDLNWQDIGSWEAYKKLFAADEKGNTILGEAILIDSENNFIHSENRMIASIGINNLAIIDTPDAMLITSRDRTQDVKEIVQTLKKQAHESYLTHRTVLRPWGSYTILEEGPTFKIKRIVVKSGAALSLQQHQHRCEHWVVVEGTAKVVNGDKEYLLHTNESTYVPMQTPHRLSNPTENDLIIIEVQTGFYLGEDDILRFEDTYGRLK